MAAFFENESTQTSLARLKQMLREVADSSVLHPEFSSFVNTSIDLFIKKPSVFDKVCAFNIQHIGSNFISEISSTTLDPDTFGRIFSSCYRFLSEYNFYHEDNFPGGVAFDVQQALNKIRYRATELPKEVKDQIVYADNFMPVALAKSYLLKADFDVIRSFETKHSDLGNIIKDLDTRIKNSKKEVSDLSDTLKNYKDAFNFVGLYKGFNDIAIAKQKAARNSIFLMVCLALLMILPFGWKIWTITQSSTPQNLNIESFLAFAGFDLLLLYFFRVIFHDYKSIRGQLVQLDLRKAACQFIQSYADYAVKIKGTNPALLEKFESLVFSGIVANEDNIPSTFDGFEQISKIIEKFK